MLIWQVGKYVVEICHQSVFSSYWMYKNVLFPSLCKKRNNKGIFLRGWTAVTDKTLTQKNNVRKTQCTFMSVFPTAIISVWSLMIVNHFCLSRSFILRSTNLPHTLHCCSIYVLYGYMYCMCGPRPLWDSHVKVAGSRNPANQSRAASCFLSWMTSIPAKLGKEVRGASRSRLPWLQSWNTISQTDMCTDYISKLHKRDNVFFTIEEGVAWTNC